MKTRNFAHVIQAKMYTDPDLVEGIHNPDAVQNARTGRRIIVNREGIKVVPSYLLSKLEIQLGQFLIRIPITLSGLLNSSYSIFYRKYSSVGLSVLWVGPITIQRRNKYGFAKSKIGG